MNAQNIYSKITGLYDIGLWIIGYKGAADFIVSKLPFGINDSFKVLDAGCGTGLYSIAVLKRFPYAQIVAFDLNQKMIEKMKTNLVKYGFEKRAEVSAGNVLENISSSQRDFDLVITGGVLEHVDIRQAVQNLAGHLQDGGYFLNSPVRDNWLGNLVAKLAEFIPHSAEENVFAFTQNNFELWKVVKIPLRYFPICLVKSAHIFKKK